MVLVRAYPRVPALVCTTGLCTAHANAHMLSCRHAHKPGQHAHRCAITHKLYCATFTRHTAQVRRQRRPRRRRLRLRRRQRPVRRCQPRCACPRLPPVWLRFFIRSCMRSGECLSIVGRTDGMNEQHLTAADMRTHLAHAFMHARGSSTQTDRFRDRQTGSWLGQRHGH